MPALFDHPEAFLARCLGWARQSVVWVVPAHAGPRGLCFAGCLPREWHGEDETPGIDIVMAELAPPSRPHHVAFTALDVLRRRARTSTDSPPISPIAWAGPRAIRAAPNSSAISPPRRGPTPPARASTLPGNQPFFFGGTNEQSMHSRWAQPPIALLSGLAWISPAVAQQHPPSPLPTQPHTTIGADTTPVDPGTDAFGAGTNAIAQATAGTA